MRIEFFDDDEPTNDIYDYERPTGDYIREYLNVTSWRCPQCNTNNFGRNEHCVYCSIRKHELIPKPGA